MNDVEIIKALECCSMPHTEVKCFCCKSTNVDICSKLNPTIILDLINRQKAEIEKLESKNNTLTIDNAILKSIIGSLKDDIQTAKSEAIREFAEELIINLDGDIEAYANAGHGLNIYEWLVGYMNSKGAIENEHWKK